jgi:hypothetical protein
VKVCLLLSMQDGTNSCVFPTTPRNGVLKQKCHKTLGLDFHRWLYFKPRFSRACTHVRAMQAHFTHTWQRIQHYSTVTQNKLHQLQLAIKRRYWGGEYVQLLLNLNLGIRRDEWSVSRSGRASSPGKRPPVPTLQEAGWAPEPVWTQRLQEKFFASAGDRTAIARSSSP